MESIIESPDALAQLVRRRGLLQTNSTAFDEEILIYWGVKANEWNINPVSLSPLPVE